MAIAMLATGPGSWEFWTVLAMLGFLPTMIALGAYFDERQRRREHRKLIEALREQERSLERIYGGR